MQFINSLEVMLENKKKQCNNENCLENMFVINPQYYSLEFIYYYYYYLMLRITKQNNTKNNGWKINVTCVPHAYEHLPPPRWVLNIIIYYLSKIYILTHILTLQKKSQYNYIRGLFMMLMFPQYNGRTAISPEEVLYIVPYYVCVF